LAPMPAPLDAPRVAIVVPARNEELNIERCVRSLLAQEYPHVEVVVVDDGSTDGTASIVERIAREDPRVRLIPGEALPAGWVGKPWALHQGVRYAGGEWLLFTDADTIHEAHALASALGYARAHNLDAVSVLTQQIMESPAEWMLLPSILYVIGFAVGSLAAINDPKRENALFNGQYILVKRAVYDALGGHEALRGEIAEDLEFARRLKADERFRAQLVTSSGLVHVRMYRSFGALWEGFVKNFGLGSRDNPAFAWAGIMFLALLSPGTPLVLALHASWALAFTGLLAWLAAGAGMARFGLQPRLALWLPLGIAVTAVIAATSMLRHARGGVTWRGRRYA
jgi:chlorobactene glucosyltransferase